MEREIDALLIIFYKLIYVGDRISHIDFRHGWY